MNAQELRDKTPDQLREELANLKKESFNLVKSPRIKCRDCFLLFVECVQTPIPTNDDRSFCRRR